MTLCPKCEKELDVTKSTRSFVFEDFVHPECFNPVDELQFAHREYMNRLGDWIYLKSRAVMYEHSGRKHKAQALNKEILRAQGLAEIMLKSIITISSNAIGE